MVFRILLLLIITALFWGCEKSEVINSVSGKYIDPSIPEDSAKVFAERIVSTGLHEHSAAIFSPDMNEMFYTVSINGQKVILQIKKNEEGVWQTPEVAPFSGLYRDEYPFYSNDGKRLYFLSFRPDSIGAEPLKKFRHWYVEKTGTGWNNPKLNKQFHPELWAYQMLKDKSIIGWGGFETCFGGADLYIQKFREGKYLYPENLGENVNSIGVEYSPAVSPDGNVLVFFGTGRDGGTGLYVSFRGDEGAWSKARFLGAEINAGGAERFPAFSPDGKYLFFNRQSIERKYYVNSKYTYQKLQEEYLYNPLNGSGDILWINSSALLKCK